MTARIPTRTNTDDRYFADRFQAMPAEGYTAMFERMLDHPNIEVRTSTDFADIGATPYDHLIFCGPIDEYFGYRFGKLPYRSLRFDHETLDQEIFQPTGTVNYPDEAVPFTRISEFKHLTGQKHATDQHRARVSDGRRRSLLPDPASGEPGALQALRGPGLERRRT